MAYNSIDGVYKNANVSILFEANEEEYYRTNEEIVKINSMVGQRLLLTALPSLSTFPPHLITQGASLGSFVITDAARKRHIQMSLNSQKAFLDHLRWFGERSIHHKESIEDYFTNEDLYNIPLTYRREQLQYWITLLEDYEHYEVGLIDVIPNLEISMKGIGIAMMRGDYTNPSNKLNLKSNSQILWPRYIHWSDEFTTLSFYLAFELFWDVIPDPWRKKEDVIKFLQKLLP
jgi:hypothetical protein